MKRSEYMTKEEIRQENLEKVVEWADAVKAGVVIVLGGLLCVGLIDIILVTVCKLFGVW